MYVIPFPRYSQAALQTKNRHDGSEVGKIEWMGKVVRVVYPTNDDVEESLREDGCVGFEISPDRLL